MSDTADDLALLVAWRAGDRERGNELFQRHIRSVSRFFRTKVPEAAEDLTQNTFLALVELDPARLGQAPFRAYLFGIARNQLLMHLRTKLRADARFDPLTRSARDAGAGPAKLVARQQQHVVLAAALQKLPIDYQVALELHYFEGMPLAEIAEVLGRPLGTIKSLLSRGREMLREHLEAMAPGDELLASLVGELERWMSSLPELVRGQADPTG
ncbi:MAG TPA: sigma-70 family RNA polymerase sigma factor [Kofleriaceae bacterium]|nr:sigma-70 family RNA polymerase sigma factor [Kofleriaceae bacterium]